MFKQQLYFNLNKHILQVKYCFFLFTDDSNKSIVYTRWGKKACPAQAELILSGDLILFTTTTINYKYFKDSLFSVF